MNDYHVHVSGMPITDKYKPDVREKLKHSLDKCGITYWWGIISPGSLYNSAEVVSPEFYHFFDINGRGLSIVRELGGVPVVRLTPDISNLDGILKRMQDEGIDLIKLFYHGEEGLNNLFSKASDIGVKAVLIHTPSDFSVIDPVYEQISKNDLQLVLGHGCLKSLELVKKVKDYGFQVDTSIHPLENIQYWIDNGALDRLVSGSDWPCGLDSSIDWNAQEREIKKLAALSKLFNKKGDVLFL